MTFIHEADKLGEWVGTCTAVGYQRESDQLVGTAIPRVDNEVASRYHQPTPLQQ